MVNHYLEDQRVSHALRLPSDKCEFPPTSYRLRLVEQQAHPGSYGFANNALWGKSRQKNISYVSVQSTTRSVDNITTCFSRGLISAHLTAPFLWSGLHWLVPTRHETTEGDTPLQHQQIEHAVHVTQTDRIQRHLTDFIISPDIPACTTRGELEDKELTDLRDHWIRTRRAQIYIA